MMWGLLEPGITLCRRSLRPPASQDRPGFLLAAAQKRPYSNQRFQRDLSNTDAIKLKEGMLVSRMLVKPRDSTLEAKAGIP